MRKYKNIKFTLIFSLVTMPMVTSDHTVEVYLQSANRYFYIRLLNYCIKNVNTPIIVSNVLENEQSIFRLLLWNWLENIYLNLTNNINKPTSWNWVILPNPFFHLFLIDFFRNCQIPLNSLWILRLVQSITSR